MLLRKVLLLLTFEKLFWKAIAPPMFCLTPYVARLPMLLIALLWPGCILPLGYILTDGSCLLLLIKQSYARLPYLFTRIRSCTLRPPVTPIIYCQANWALIGDRVAPGEGWKCISFLASAEWSYFRAFCSWMLKPDELPSFTKFLAV